jgi:hypothetical protein
MSKEVTVEELREKRDELLAGVGAIGEELRVAMHFDVIGVAV